MTTEFMEPKKKKSDGMEDLFSVNREDLLDTDDVVSVDIKKDILDANEEGDISDVTEVTEEDIMGDEDYGQSPLEGAPTQRKKKAAKLSPPSPIAYPKPIQISNIGQ